MDVHMIVRLAAMALGGTYLISIVARLIKRNSISGFAIATVAICATAIYWSTT